jgi:hypothetical protein
MKLEKFMQNKFFYSFLIIAIGYFILQLFLAQDLAVNSDEGTHLITGLFYKDFIYNLKNFHSLNDVTKFIINYIVQYSKVTLYYPPLYHLLLAIFFSIKENIMIARTLNIILTILSSCVIYKLACECFGNKAIAIFSLIFFLNFTIIFFYANKVIIDILQILVFSLALWYYFKLKKIKVRNLHFKNLLILSILMSLSFLTKFYSIFIPIIILLDSFIYDKKFFKKIFISLILSFLIVSPYAYLYYRFQMYKLAIEKATTLWENSLVYFDIFRNFGVFLSFFVVFSLICFFYKNRKNYIFFIWFFIPLAILISLKNADPRYAFILMPIYSIACGFTFIELIKMFRSKLKKSALILFILSLIILQLIYNTYLSYPSNNSFVYSQGPKYPVDEIMKSVKNDGNVLVLSEKPVYSSVFMFYGRTNKISGNVIRPCVFTLTKTNLTKDFLHAWGVKYIIDQENILNESLIKLLNLNDTLEKRVGNTSLRLFEVQEEIKKIDCNFVCILLGKVCKNANFSEIIPLINNNIYTMKE